MEHERSAKRVRFSVKSKSCSECQGPCHVPAPPFAVEVELEELNGAVGNWRHKKARNAAIRDAASRPRAIPEMADAQTDAQRKMAALAAKFRKP